MANEQNLVDLATRPQQERIEIARKGQAAATKVKNEKKNRKEQASEMLNLIVEGAGIDKIKKFFDLKGKPLNAYQVMFLSCCMKAMQKGDANALEKLLKIAGEQFAELLDVSVGKSEKLADILEQLGSDDNV